MKKRLKRLLAVMLVFSLVALVFSACDSKDRKVYDKVYAHLNDKYKGVEFQINSHVQDTEASGKYVFDVTCVTTGVDFEVIMTSLFMSDSYFVSHANKRIADEIDEALGAAKVHTRMSHVQCFDLYLNDSGPYRFNEKVSLNSAELQNISEIYRVYLSGVESPEDAAQCLIMFCDVLESRGYVFSKISFEFVLNKETVRVETSTSSLTKNSPYDSLERLLEEAKSPSQMGNLFYRDPESDIKVIPFFTE